MTHADGICTVIVDDQDDVRLLIRMIVEASGRFKVTEAASGAELLEMIEHHVPDAIVLDIMMPGMDGLETARRIREQRPDQKILFCSAHLDDGVVDSIDQLRGELFVAKEDVADLPAQLEALVAR